MIVGLIAFLVIDMVLVAWAVAAANTPRSNSGAPAGGLQTTASIAPPTPSSTPTPTPSSTTPPIADAVAPTRLLAAVDANTAWRAATGSCPGGRAAVQLTTDAGASWKQSDAARATSASALIRLSALSARQASAIGLVSQGCAPEFIRTYVGGDTWATYADQLSLSWYLNPGSNGVVHSPHGDVPAPCAGVVGLAVGSSANAAVLCAGHDVYRTVDGGAHWGAPQQVPAAVAIGASGDGYVAAAVGATGCAGVQIVSLPGGAGPGRTVGCVGSSSPGAGAVAISGGGGALWLWAGDVVARSTDGGTTWR